MERKSRDNVARHYMGRLDGDIRRHGMKLSVPETMEEAPPRTEADLPAPDTDLLTDMEKKSLHHTYTMNVIFSIIVSLVGFFGAFYLSFKCNTTAGMGTFTATLHGIIAGFFNYLYMIYYYLVRTSDCLPKIAT